VSNRRISEFPSIIGADIAEQDLMTLVHVFEVDPVLRNKRITFTEFKNYLNQYYPNTSSGGFTGNITINGNITISGLVSLPDASNVQLGTGTGTKIGTATTQKIGFYNATPVVQPTAVADATDAASVITQLNLLLGRMRTLGLIAT
jgi:hypothetical protein